MTLGSLLARVMWATGSACHKKWLLSVQAISTWPATCAGPACVQNDLARPDSQFLCCTHVYLSCNVLWPEVQSHSDNSHRHVTILCSACKLTQACPTMSCIHLVIKQVATALLVAGSTLTCWILWQTSFASTSSYSSVIQSARLLV